MPNFLSSIAMALGLPDPSTVEADATLAGQQLQTAFAILIGEGAIAIALLLVLVVANYKERHGA
jgi:hypothetical protein